MSDRKSQNRDEIEGMSDNTRFTLAGLGLVLACGIALNTWVLDYNHQDAVTYAAGAIYAASVAFAFRKLGPAVAVSVWAMYLLAGLLVIFAVLDLTGSN